MEYLPPHLRAIFEAKKKKEPDYSKDLARFRELNKYVSSVIPSPIIRSSLATGSLDYAYKMLVERWGVTDKELLSKIFEWNILARKFDYRWVPTEIKWEPRKPTKSLVKSLEQERRRINQLLKKVPSRPSAAPPIPPPKPRTGWGMGTVLTSPEGVREIPTLGRKSLLGG